MICTLCPRNCNIDRENHVGFCGAGEKIRVARAAPHFWEEPPISGTKGSGTVFFSGCNLRCVFCQNNEISHLMKGKDITETELMRVFDNLINQGVHNINLVTPTHYAHLIRKVLEKYHSPVPVVYNTSSYEKADTIKSLEGLVDIYLPDLKYVDSAPALKYSGAEDYFNVASKAILEMYRQVGDIVIGDDGTAKRGIIVRHMILPGNVSQAAKAAEFVADKLSYETHFSLMRQYTPYAKALDIPQINRKISPVEYKTAKRKVIESGLENIYFQRSDSSGENFIPDFNGEGVDLF